ncbi:Putative ribonuclease H protein At1g65750 [Linum perenne]
MGLRNVELQMDSRAAIELLISTREPMHQHAAEVISFHKLHARDWPVNIRHMYQEGNQVSDFLANRGHDFPFGFHLFFLSDCNLDYFLRYDCLGVSEPRYVLINNCRNMEALLSIDALHIMLLHGHKQRMEANEGNQRNCHQISNQRD